jgi:hypothetical protein
MWGKELGPVYYYFIIFGEFSPNFENKKMISTYFKGIFMKEKWLKFARFWDYF